MEYFKTSADVAIYGGAAGGGKTWALLVDPLRYMEVNGFGAIIFRRNLTQITIEGGLWDESMKVYPLDGASPVGHQWRWPNDNKVTFAHLQHEETKLSYQGAQIAYIGFDELTHFSETQFWYMLSRNRSLCGVKPYIRATCNADSDSWVARLISWYWDQNTGYPIPGRGGVVRYFIRRDQDVLWGDTEEELYEANKTWMDEQYAQLLEAGVPQSDIKIIKSFTFIPAKIYDNKILLRKDPDYLANLHAQLPIEKERLLFGNWKINPTAGDIFNRDWFTIVPHAPKGGKSVRFWDFAATEAKLKDRGDGPSYTASVLLRRIDDVYYIEDMINVRLGPADIDQLLHRTTREDAAWAKSAGCSYAVRWEIEPGSASKRETYRMRSMLARIDQGLDANGVRPQGDKIQRAKPFAVVAQRGNVFILDDEWNDELLTHLHNQPDSPHDDIMDACSGGYYALDHLGRYKSVRY